MQKAQWKQIVERFTSLDAETFLRDFTGQVIWVALKIAVAFAIYAAGRWIINRLVHLMDASFDRRQVDKSLRSFLRSLVKGAAYTILLLIIVQLLGFNTTSLVALLAASGFGIGMALSGTLQNFAGGIMVMFMHPYRIGDYIEAQGQAGTVKEIRLFSTVVTTTDNKRIYIPNSSISNAIVNNYSSETMRRVEWKVSLAYGDDVAVAKRTMLAMLESDKRVLHTPDAPADPFVALSELADSAIVVVARTWTLNGDYWDLFFDMNERFLQRIAAAGVAFPPSRSWMCISTNKYGKRTMKKLIVWTVLSAAVAVLPSCGDDEGEECSTPVISEVNYSPKKSVEERRGDRDGQDTQRTLSVPGLCDLPGGFDYGYVGQYDGELSLDRSRLFDRGGRDLRLHGQDSRHEADRSQGAFHDRSDDAASPLCLF